MKDNNSTFPLPLSHYIVSFIAIQILWMVGGNYLTSQLLFVTQSSIYASSPLLLYFIQHVNFFLLFFLLTLFIRIVVRSSVLSFITDRSRFNFLGFFLGLGVWLISMIINSFINILWLHQTPIVQYNNALVHIMMFLLAIMCSPVQVFCEEVLFRSFFYQALKNRVHNRYLVATISALFFTLAHSFNSELLLSPSPFFILLYYFLSGFFFMLLTYRYKGIEVALGAHIMNNFYIATIMNYQDSSIISYPFFIIGNTNIYVDLILLTLTSMLLLVLGPNQDNPIEPKKEIIYNQ